MVKFDATNQVFRMCTDVENDKWDAISFQSLAEDTYCKDGENVDYKFDKVQNKFVEVDNKFTQVNKNISDLDNKKQDKSTAITTSNIGKQHVAYADKAGTADTVKNIHWNDITGKPDVVTKDNMPNYDDRYYVKSKTYSKDEVNGKFLQLSGGTMTGSIKISKGGLNLQNEGITMNNCAIIGVSGISGVNTPGDQAGLQIFSATGNSATNKDIFLVCKRTRCVHYGFTGELNTYADLYCDRLHYVNPPMTDSSRLVKENITDMSNEEAEKILDVDVKDFDYIEGFGDKGQHGVIAEELEEILPNLVYTPEGYREEDFDASKGAVDNKVKSVSYVGFIPYLIKALQIQNEKIKELESKVETLSK